MTDAMEYLKRVEARARELYALSDQGPWEALPDWMKQLWIRATDEELRLKGGG